MFGPGLERLEFLGVRFCAWCGTAPRFWPALSAESERNNARGNELALRGVGILIYPLPEEFPVSLSPFVAPNWVLEQFGDTRNFPSSPMGIILGTG